MAEYIDRELLLEHLEYLNNELPLVSEHDWGRALGYDEVIDEVKKYPYEDVQPVKHGKWIQDEHTYSGHWTYNFVCSACGELGGTWIRNIRRDQMFQYCPFCGARMDMEDNCDD